MRLRLIGEGAMPRPRGEGGDTATVSLTSAAKSFRITEEIEWGADDVKLAPPTFAAKAR